MVSYAANRPFDEDLWWHPAWDFQCAPPYWCLPAPRAGFSGRLLSQDEDFFWRAARAYPGCTYQPCRLRHEGADAHRRTVEFRLAPHSPAKCPSEPLSNPVLEGIWPDYGSERAITMVMSSCCSPALNWWTAPTTAWSSEPTGRWQ